LPIGSKEATIVEPVDPFESSELDGFQRTPGPAPADDLCLKQAIDGRPCRTTRRAVRHWAGLRPMTPSGRPFFGRTRVGNLFVNTGHGPLGWTLAARSARLLAAMIAGEATPVDAAPFAVPATLMTGVSVVSGTSVFHPLWSFIGDPANGLRR
jgi:glycine/D-amino acid oxidase-like deaminating enzyme